MIGIEHFMSFSEITFPIFLLVLALIGSLPVLVIQPQYLARLFAITMLDYFVIVSAIGYSLFINKAWTALGFFSLSLVLVTLGLFTIIRWTMQQFIWAWIESLAKRKSLMLEFSE